ncbi:Clavaminate synthase-like protein [Phlegmacium glaucopus]|nr:Clavaminate synthase-like protein [Phlegmacium glaucopus]
MSLRVTTNEHTRVNSNIKPLEPWVFSSVTKLIPEEQYVDLEVIDLSEFHGLDDSIPPPLRDPTDIITRTMKALANVGFIVIKGHGLSDKQIHHQFSLGKLLAAVPESEKHALHASIKEGSWAGYKPRGYYTRPSDAFDTLEHYDLYPFTALESNLPHAAKPYLSDFRQFIEHNHYIVLRKVLGIISLGLGLEVDTLWKLHHRGGHANDGALRGGLDDKIEWKHTKDHLRYAMYHPLAEGDREKSKHLMIPGHTDLGSVSFLYSQPIAGLQVQTPDGEWRYVRHYPNHIIVNLGDCMEFMTGQVLKATPHRVKEPPGDQRHLERLGVFYFVPFLPDIVLSPLDCPSLSALGVKDVFEEYYALGGKPMTSEEWLVERSKLVGTTRVVRQSKGTRDVLEEIHFRYNPN